MLYKNLSSAASPMSFAKNDAVVTSATAGGSVDQSSNDTACGCFRRRRAFISINIILVNGGGFDNEFGNGFGKGWW
ncbi:hypothetical protein SAMD00019534_078060 [Acytostelium subglobosum LB1]|uniref:hypothetical protein n=1 Tax=Acytostelium subglobosum LB1 TaxID=1410327 RepID=UPI00064485CC|nr:hypothetical protein SAMD00019534_078060 [Acytostelium subglobosum LB1]GAM24631.1 hypothetical protein SAMD00019534_078060 [Acytostelium subglobosum LB1]|eukprot:XP_012752300.1 hypothetical protein SAMD00019534_078060 [Acytostelium subglobosum LB1]